MPLLGGCIAGGKCALLGRAGQTPAAGRELSAEQRGGTLHAAGRLTRLRFLASVYRHLLVLQVQKLSISDLSIGRAQNWSQFEMRRSLVGLKITIFKKLWAKIENILNF